MQGSLRFQTLTVGGDIVNSSYHRLLEARTSLASRVILTYKDFDGAEHSQHNLCLVYIIDVL